MPSLREIIERELEQFLEWPTADKSHVTTVSAKLFAEHVAQLYADHIRGAAKKVMPDVQGEPSRESLMVVLERDEYGKPAVWCDPEIADLVSALNGSGVRTIASCSGHGKRPGNIVLADGRELVIARSFEESRIVDSIFQGINGEPARAVVVPKTAVQGEPVGEVRFELGAPSYVYGEIYSDAAPRLGAGGCTLHRPTRSAGRCGAGGGTGACAGRY